MNHNFDNKLSHDFRCQFPNIRVPVHDSEKTIGIQQLILLGADFAIQRGDPCGKLLLFSFMALCQHLKLLTGQIFKGQLLKGFAEKLIQISKAFVCPIQTDKLKDKGANLASYTVLADFADFLYYEFTELLKQGLSIRRCKNCGQYFVLKSKHPTYYCDRKQEMGRTCKQIGGKREYQNRLVSDPALQEYERIYKLHHAQMERDEQKERPTEQISRAKKEFLKWSKQAQALRKRYLAEELNHDQFLFALKQQDNSEI